MNVAEVLGRLRRLATRYDFRRPSGLVYLTRWVLPRVAGRGAFLHRFRGGDSEVFHNHPWASVSLILSGGYWEVTPRGRRWHGPGRVVYRPAARLHRVELPPGRECWTLFLHGRPTRGWGFWCPRLGWVPWRPGIADADVPGSGCSGR